LLSYGHGKDKWITASLNASLLQVHGIKTNAIIKPIRWL